MQESIQTGTKAHASISPLDVGRVDFKDEPPILCETICRPVNDTEMSSARDEAGNTEASIQNTQAHGAANAAAMSFMEIESKICTAKGASSVVRVSLRFDASRRWNCCSVPARTLECQSGVDDGGPGAGPISSNKAAAAARRGGSQHCVCAPLARPSCHHTWGRTSSGIAWGAHN